MKKEHLVQLLIVLIGLPIGAYFSNRTFTSHQESESSLSLNHTSMDHGMLDISQDSIVPQIIAVEITKDSMSGWNLEVMTENFRFTPENASKNHIPGEGHAHLYLNGEKYARVYGPYFHIPDVGYEIQEIKLSLNANGHETLAIQEKPIEKMILL